MLFFSSFEDQAVMVSFSSVCCVVSTGWELFFFFSFYLSCLPSLSLSLSFVPSFLTSCSCILSQELFKDASQSIPWRLTSVLKNWEWILIQCLVMTEYSSYWLYLNFVLQFLCQEVDVVTHHNKRLLLFPFTKFIFFFK